MRILVFQHLANEGPGRFLDHVAAEGATIETVRFWQNDTIPALEPYDVLWVMGGDMDVWDVDIHPWLIEEKRAIRHWVLTLGRPFLGICLGHQLLADALNGTCGPLGLPEIGIYEIELSPDGLRDPLFAGVDKRFLSLQWHSVRVAQPPEGAIVLAATPDCRVQAMRYGKHAFGLQFHIEARASAVEEWGCVPDYRRALDKAAGTGGYDRLAAEFSANDIAFADTAATICRNFLAIAQG